MKARFIQWWKRQSTTKKVLGGIVLLIILFIILGKGKDSGAQTIETVKRQTLVRSVAASGTVVSSTDLSLGFEQSKMVSSIKVVVGSTVKKGDILASLSNRTEQAAVKSAKGALLAAQARYNKVLEGSSNEEIKLAQTQVENARRALLSDDLIAKPENSDVTVAPTISGTYTGTEGEYRLEFNALAQNTLEYSGVETGKVRVYESAPIKLGTKGLYVQFAPGTLKDISSGTVWIVMLPNIEGASYIANKAALDEAQAKLDITRATARQPDIDAALADMITAQAGVDSANANLEKTILRAPADGTVTAVDVKVGEIPTLGKQAIAIQDVSNLYLEANVNESSIKSIAVGQPVKVTYDAFTGDSYMATVSSVDPAATIEDNVVNYKVKALIQDIEHIRPGMTANMTIETARKEQVLAIPNRAITYTDSGATVDKITDSRKQKTTTTAVTVGLIGDGDLVEIVSGLSEGDSVLWSTN